MKFKMKIEDVFHAGSKTILSGTLQTAEEHIGNMLCTLKIGEKNCGEIKIEGEVLIKRTEVSSRKALRNLWTLSSVSLNQATLREENVLLISE